MGGGGTSMYNLVGWGILSQNIGGEGVCSINKSRGGVGKVQDTFVGGGG